jgi:mercuric reductase
MNKFKINIQGMTCTGCEEHVAVALENIGAKNIQASFRCGEAVFELSEILGLKVQKRQLMKQNINLEK